MNSSIYEELKFLSVQTDTGPRSQSKDSLINPLAPESADIIALKGCNKIL